VEQRVASKQIDRFCVVELEFLLDNHDELEDGEGLED
jgi:hypothetical protein